MFSSHGGWRILTWEYVHKTFSRIFMVLMPILRFSETFLHNSLWAWAPRSHPPSAWPRTSSRAKRENLDLTETMKVKRWTFHKPGCSQKHRDIHFLWVLELHHRSLQSPERILCCVGPEDDSRDPLPRSSRRPHCGTAAPEHRFHP